MIYGRILDFCVRGRGSRLARSSFDFSTFFFYLMLCNFTLQIYYSNLFIKCMLFKELEGIRVKGKGCPKPIKTWAQCGVSKKELDVLKKQNYERPTPIQVQAIPAIMSGMCE